MGGVCSCMGAGGGVEAKRQALEALVSELLAMRVSHEETQLPDGAMTAGDNFVREKGMERDITHVADASDIRALCSLAAKELLKQPTVLDLDSPIHIVGDIHGQFQDLLRIFEHLGTPPATKFLFLGDYVDRGPHSLEVIVILLSMKLLYPDSVYLLRGNHECEGVSMVYGFFQECRTRYSSGLWNHFIPVFDALPIAAIVRPSEKATEQLAEETGKGLFCVHAGLSPALDSIQAIRRIRRPCKVQSSQIVSDLVWSDPNSTHTGWAYGDRGVSCTYGIDVAAEFLKNHSLQMIVRAHEVVDNGYLLTGSDSPKVATVFSVPGYAGVCTNDAAVLHVDSTGAQTWHILPFGKHVRESQPEPINCTHSVKFHQRERKLERLLSEDLVPPEPGSIPPTPKETLQDKAQDILMVVGDSLRSKKPLEKVAKISSMKHMEQEAASSRVQPPDEHDTSGNDPGQETASFPSDEDNRV